MVQITKKQYATIHKDYRGSIDGCKTAFKNSILRLAGLPLSYYGTDLFVETVHFEFV